MQKVNKPVNFSQEKLFVNITERASLFIKYGLDENTSDKNFHAKRQKASQFFSRNVLFVTLTGKASLFRKYGLYENKSDENF